MTEIRSRSRIGMMGGTFDPPHVGHIAVAVAARHQLRLDRVLLVVAHDPWQKSGRGPVTSASERLAMAALAVEGVPGVEVDDRELARGGPSFTVDTLQEMGQEHPGAELFVVLGRDAALGLPSWHDVPRLRGLATFAVAERGDSATGSDAREPLPEGFSFVRIDVPRLDISSTDLRRRARSGEPLDGLVHPAVASYLATHPLYGGAE